jgi:hypothetical protein
MMKQADPAVDDPNKKIEVSEEDDDEDEEDEEGEDQLDRQKPAQVPPGLAMRQRFRNTPTTFTGQVSSWLGGLRTGLLAIAQDQDPSDVPDVVPIGY